MESHQASFDLNYLNVCFRDVATVTSSSGEGPLSIRVPLADPLSLCPPAASPPRSLNQCLGSVPTCTCARRPGCSVFPSTPHSSVCFLLSAWLFTDLPFPPHQPQWLLINSSGLFPPACVCHSGSPTVPLLPSPPHLSCYLHRNLSINPESSFSTSSICLSFSFYPLLSFSSFF